MAVSRLSKFTTREPTPIDARCGTLVIAAASIAHRVVNAAINAFTDCSACLSESRHHDKLHDAYLTNLEILARRGVQVSATNGCPCGARYQAILRDVKAAQACDAREDCLIEKAFVIARRWAGALEKALRLRRQPARPRRGEAGSGQ
jgi:hypothetical protein